MAHIRSYATAKPCEYCGGFFNPRRDALKVNRGRFCSIGCANLGKNGEKPLNKKQIKKAMALYKEGMTLRQVGKFYSVGWKRIRNILADAGVSIRRGGRVGIGRSRYRYTPIAEKKIGRKLRKGEVVHHINGISIDDKEENLTVVTRRNHGLLHKKLNQMACEMVRANLILFQGDTYVFSSKMERLLKYV